jgi:hypothetical protein
MKVKPAAKVTRSVSMRRDMRYVERALRELTKPQDDDVLDIAKVRYELERLIGAIPPDRMDASLYEAIDEFVDSHVAEFLRRMRERHDDQLGRLDRLRIKVVPYALQAKALIHNEVSVLRYLDAAVTNALDWVANPETPLRDPRVPDEPRERPL